MDEGDLGWITYDAASIHQSHAEEGEEKGESVDKLESRSRAIGLVKEPSKDQLS